MDQVATSQTTIFALSSAAGRAGVAVFRISGPQAHAAIRAIAGEDISPRHASFRTFQHPVSRVAIDRGIVLWFPGSHSFTGEDVVEFQCHGGPAITRAMLEALGAVPGCRLAEPGEFARRAFETGKISLADAEGLADLIEAETEAQRVQALSQADGVTSQLYEAWRDQIIEASALTEAAIDFSDEADVGEQSMAAARMHVEELHNQIDDHLDDGHRGEIIRDGFRVVIAGAPNVGKSSLLNALAQRDVAIVSSETGTTRDVLEVRLDLGGLPVVVTDTAGLREAPGEIEQEGIRRALGRIDEAELVLWLVDPDSSQTAIPDDIRDRCEGATRVVSKSDLISQKALAFLKTKLTCVSAKTGAGIGDLVELIKSQAQERIGSGGDVVVAQVRHRQLLEACVGHLSDYLDGTTDQVELRAEDLRLAANALGRITGRVDVEDVLDQVFSRFCIGK